MTAEKRDRGRKDVVDKVLKDETKGGRKERKKRRSK